MRKRELHAYLILVLDRQFQSLTNSSVTLFRNMSIKHSEYPLNQHIRPKVFIYII